MQQSVSGWERPSFRNRLDEPLDGRTVSRDAVQRFEPARAGLPEISARDACSYIEAHQSERPWLAAARGCPPEVQAPRAVTLDVRDLLGPEGHRYCTGWRLLPVDGRDDRARAQRTAWVDARAQGRLPDAPAPEARPVQSFEGGKIISAFGPNSARNGYEVLTMYPRPRAGESQGDAR